MILFWLQAKWQLFHEYTAMFENFFGSRSKKACFFVVERLLKNFCTSRKKPLLRPKEHQKLNTAASMVAEIGIDALKI